MAGSEPEEEHAYPGPLQPVLRWAGSKKRSLPQIVPHLSLVKRRYIEVFAGSACLFFATRPEQAIISDNNWELIAFYETLAQHADDVYDRFISIPRNPESYYRIRAAARSERDRVTRSAFFLYLNRNCFNGIFRTNAQGVFNVPFSSSRVPRYPMLEQVRAAGAALADAQVCCGDFERVCRKNVSVGDMVYLDPPYYITSRRVFREYSSKPFSGDDLLRLADLLSEIDGRGAHFLLSYPDCSFTRDLAKRWRASRIDVMRTIAGKLSSRGYAREILVRNY
jgi:DNA adenine methylase